MSNTNHSRLYLTRVSDEGAARAARLVHYDEGYQAVYGAQGDQVALVFFLDSEGIGTLIAYEHQTGRHGTVGYFPALHCTTEVVELTLASYPFEEV